MVLTIADIEHLRALFGRKRPKGGYMAASTRAGRVRLWCNGEVTPDGENYPVIVDVSRPKP